jgi:hypothetical protein
LNGRAEPQPAPELAALRERLAQLAADLDDAAKATAPSKKSDIERELAATVRAILEG